MYVKMLKYVNTMVTFSEVPDEISLCINISNCPCHCEECHSSYLAEDIGEPLDLQHLTDLINSNKGISCVCIMGGDINPSEVNNIAKNIKKYYPALKIGWYSGRQDLSKDINLENFNYIKLGPYIKDRGPINCKTTNQKMYQIIKKDNSFFKENITFKFW